MTRLWTLFTLSLLVVVRNEECCSCHAFPHLSSSSSSSATASVGSPRSQHVTYTNIAQRQNAGLSPRYLQAHINDDLLSSSSSPHKKILVEKSRSSNGHVVVNEEQHTTTTNHHYQRTSNWWPFQPFRTTIQQLMMTKKNIVGTAVATLFLLASVLVHDPPVAVASSYYAMSDEQKTIAEAWRLVDNSFLDRTFNHQDWFQVRQTYVNGKKYKSMDDAHTAIAAMVQSLGDPYTRYLTPGQYQSLVDAATGTFAGIGVEISQAKKDPALFIYASDVQPNSPAARGGLKINDKFRRVGSVEFMVDKTAAAAVASSSTFTPDDVAVQLRGPPGSKVSVTMERPDGTTYDVILTRESLTVAAVQSYLLPSNPKVGVIRIKNFSGTTADKVKEEWIALQKKGANSLVLDVRGNPGGLLPGGVDTAGLFLTENAPLVYVVNKQGIVDAQATLTIGTFSDTPSSPLIVLVDANTASAAEVMTAALQENGRAVVAGQPTFGKGIVQTVRELSNQQGGVAITVARYETPSHKDINKQGITVTVDAPVDCPKDNVAACLPPSVFQATAKSAL
jgi:carboxyl-terminal processing protease